MNVWYPRDEVVDALRWHVCNTPYDFSSATVPDLSSIDFDGYRWNVGFNWPPGIERTLRLSLPPNHPATGDPVISGTVQVGEVLTALTDGIMDDDVLDDVFTYQWVRVDADGTSNKEDITDETDATYTLTADDRGTKVKVEVRFVDILGGKETRTSAPTATLAGVPNTAATGAPTITGTAQVGQTLTASTTGIADANGLTSPNYTYQWIRVDGTEADIASANSSTYILVDADLGTTLKVKVTFADDLGHTETLTSAATATVTAVATAPTVSTVDVTSMPASGDTYGTGEMIQFTVTFDQDVTVTGTPEFEFCLGNSDGGSCTDGSPPPTRRRAALSSGSGTTALVFSYTVVAGDMDDDGIWIGDQDRTIKLDTGDAIRGTVGGLDAVLTHPSGGAQTGHKVNGGAAATAQTVNDVAVTSTPASGTTYYLAGEVIEFTVTFSAPVTVTGTPKFAFRLGAATRQAAYASGSDSAALVFARTVQAGEVDRNGISWNALAIALDGGTITQTGATTAASLTHAEQAPLEGHRVDAAPPMQVSASVQGMSLVLVYDEPLDPASMPATGAYTVTATVGATTTNPAVSEVSIYGIWVTLTLDAAPAAGATVTLAYAPPASNPVQDEAGNDAPAFSGQSVRLGPPPPDLAQVMGVGVAPGNAQLVVTWTAVDTATGYTVQWTSGSQGYNTGDRQATVTTGSTTRYTIPSLTNGTAYTVRVIATRTGVTDGPPSEEMTGTPGAPPAAPQDLRSEPGDAEVTLRWAAPASDGGSPILRYEYALDDSGTWIDAGGDLEETVRDLTNGQSYTVAVRAVNVAGAGPAAQVTGTPGALPGAPQRLRSEPGDAEVTLRWAAPASDGGPPILRYEYALDDSGTWIDAGGDLEETVPGLTNGQSHAVAVRAVNAAGAGPAATVTASPVTTPAAPQDLRSEPGNAQVTLTWDAPTSDGRSPILRYEYAIDDSGTWIDAGGDLEETVRDLTNGQRYTVAVRAVNAAGAGPAAEVTATPVTTPGAPQRLRSEPGDAEVTLRWAAPASDGGSAILRYKYALDDSGTWIDAGGDLEETVRDLTNGQSCAVAVRAVNAAGAGPAAEVTATPVTTPGAPQRLRLEPGDAEVTLRWAAPASDGGSAILRYEYALDGSETWIDAGDDLEETVRDLTSGRSYAVAVRAVNAAGAGPAAEVTATPVTTPGAPQRLRSEPGDAEVTLRWDAPTSDGRSPILRYEYAIDGSETWIDAGGDLEETVRDLTNGQSYAVAVRAVNAAGAGPATTVTSVPADPLPQAWLARFGRTATDHDHVVDAVSSRWHGGPQASHLTLGGPAEALLGWTGLGGQAARDTAADRGDSVRTEMASPRLLAPSGGAGPGVGGDRSGDDRGRD